jgi:hypothetical protein
LVVVIALIFAFSACTTITVQPIDASIGLHHVCIHQNPKVLVTDFVQVIRDGFMRHEISTEVFSGTAPEGCEYILTYTALRSWDIVPFLSHAELYLKHEGRTVASAEFHLKGKGGYALTKFQGTKKKMDPVIDQLLAAY